LGEQIPFYNKHPKPKEGMDGKKKKEEFFFPNV
jgi:hypothetical protein